MEISVYKTARCDASSTVIEALEGAGHEVRTVNLDTPAGLTELRGRGCYSVQTPLICIDQGGEYWIFEPSDIFRCDDLSDMKPLRDIDPRLG